MKKTLPVLGICAAASNAGKTTLIKALLQEFTRRSIRISVIKHAHHQFDIDHPGKDSYQIREAGAVQTIVASKHRWALMTEMSRTANANNEANLDELLTQLNPDYADLVLVEGFKFAPIPKIEVYQHALQQPMLAETNADIVAIVTDYPVIASVPSFDRNAISDIANFIQTLFLKSF